MKTLSTILFFVCPLCAYAQGNVRDTITQKVHRIAEVVVVSKPADANIGAVAPTQTIGSDRMLQLGVQSMHDALKHFAGITVRDYGGAGGLKTVSVRGLGARHTAVVYDGIVLSDCQTGEIDLSRYSLQHIDNLALIIGDGDDIFTPARNMSAAATLQLTNAQAPTADRRPHADAQLTLGSWGTVSPSVFYGQNLSNRFRMSVIGEYTYAENDYPYTLINYQQKIRRRRNHSRMNSGHIESNMTWVPSPGHSLTGKVYYYDNARQLPGIARYYTDLEFGALHDRNAFGQFQYKGILSDKWSVLAHAKYNWSETVYQETAPTGDVLSEQYLQNEVYGSAAVLYAPFEWLAVDCSTDYIRNMMKMEYRPVRHTFLQSVSAKVGWKRLSLTLRMLGTRCHYQVEEGQAGNDEHQLSPSVSMSWQVLSGRDLYVRALWKKIFRLPTFTELYYRHLGTTDLKPENTNQLNFGINWASRTNGPLSFALTADAYLNRVTDKIVAIPFNMFVWRMMNMAKVYAYGVDITNDIQYVVNQRHTIGLVGNYSWQKVENRIKRSSPYYHHQIAYTPVHSVSMTLSWKNPWVNLSLTGDGMSERWATNEHYADTRIPGFFEIDFSAYKTFTVRRNHYTVRGSLLNILDKQYDIVAHYPMPGRSWRVTIEIKI